jgi:DNA-binding GntR family transcriptional regulator
MSKLPDLKDFLTVLNKHLRPGLPKYIALRDAVIEMASSSAWPSGMRLMTEAQWAQELPISLGTIQRAFRMLVEDGVIHRRQGQGSFLASGDLGRMHAPLHCRFIDDSGHAYLPVYSTVLSKELARGEGVWADHVGKKDIYKIDRILDIGNEFLAHSSFWINVQKFTEFKKLPLKKLSGENFKEIIWNNTHQPVGKLVQYLEMKLPPKDIQQKLKIKPSIACQFLQVFAYIGQNQPLYYQEIWIPFNSRKLDLASDGRDKGLYR